MFTPEASALACTAASRRPLSMRPASVKRDLLSVQKRPMICKLNSLILIPMKKRPASVKRDLLSVQKRPISRAKEDARLASIRHACVRGKRDLLSGQKRPIGQKRPVIRAKEAYWAKETCHQGKRGLLGKRDTFGDDAEDFFNTTLFTTLFTTQETPLATAPKISSTPLLAFAEVSTATAPTLDANSSASSCVTCVRERGRGGE